jgi:Tn3 transposase DDE domain
MVRKSCGVGVVFFNLEIRLVVEQSFEHVRGISYGRVDHLGSDLLLEVDRRIGFTDDFNHLKSQEPAKDQPLLLTVILADAMERIRY